MRLFGGGWRRFARARAGIWAVLLLYAAVASVTVFRHEMWRDEMHAWQAVVASDSLLELTANVQSEGHPGLWYLLLYPVSRVTAAPGAMQLVHLAIAIASAALVLLAAPLPTGWRVLFVFGYFPLYEYAAISRSYALGGLLLFVSCALYGDRWKRPLVLAGVLALLAQATVYALILSVLLGLVWLSDAWLARGGLSIRRGLAGAALALWLAGIGVSVAQPFVSRLVSDPVNPERKAKVQPFDPERIFDPSSVLDTLSAPWRGYAPLPRLRFAFWNSNLLDGLAAGDVLQAGLGIALIVALGRLFVRSSPALLLYVCGSVSLLAFSWLVRPGTVRHDGHHLLLLMAALWLAGAVGRTDGGHDASPSGRVEAPPRPAALVGLLLAVNVAAGGYAVVRDLRDPFSAGEEVARHIRAQGLAGLPIVSDRDVVAAVVAGHLGQPIYCTALGREVSFLRWSVATRRALGDAEVLRDARSLAEEKRSEVLILLRAHGRAEPDRLDGAIWAGHFSRSIVSAERFELFRLPPSGLAGIR